MTLPSRQKIENACQIVYEAMAPTAQYCWPLLGERAGCEVWLKHENHGPLGAFKMRSALVYFRRLRETGRAPRVAVTATRGNRSEEHTSELQSHLNLVCRLLLEKKTRR